MASKPAGSSGPAVVTRRVNPNGAMGSTVKQKPSIRRTIDSMVSTGSQSEYFKPEQTIIIFDWDDTICPSSWIRENKRVLSFFKPAPKDEQYQRPLRELQQHAETLIKLAMKLGNVIIVTNAMDPWVETSCRNFLPQLLPLVSTLPVVYARSIYETQSVEPPKVMTSCSAALRSLSPARIPLPGMYTAGGQNKLAGYNQKLATQRFDDMAPQRWKEVAFEQEINTFYSRYKHQSWKNVISVGDSIFERDAVRRVVLQRPDAKKKCRTKTVKMFDDPTIDELIAQVRVVCEVLGVMVQHDGDLDIEIDEQDLKVDMPLVSKLMD